MVLFNIYYDGDSPTDFAIDLDENAIIKRESVARLLKAYIPHAKDVVLTDTEVMTLVVNDRNATPLSIKVPATGQISLTTLASQIQNAINSSMTGDNENITAGVSFDRSKGHSAGAFKIDIKARSRHFVDIQEVNWNESPYDDLDYISEEEVNGVSTDVSYTKTGDYFLNADFRDGAGNPVAVGSTAQAFIANNILKLDYFAKYTFPDRDYPPSTYEDYGCVIFEVGNDIGTNTIWGGVCSNNQQNTMVDRQPNDNLGLLTELNNVPCCMVVPKTTRNAGTPNNTGAGAFDLVAGGFYALEMTDTGDLNLVVSQDDLNMSAGDLFSAVFSENQLIKYFIKKNGDATWTPVDTIDGRTRYVVKADDELRPCGSIFEVSGANTEVIGVVGGSLDVGELDQYGKYIQAELNASFATAMGFTSSPYTADTSATETLADLSFSNESDITIVETSENCPFVNINITNLPLKGFVNNNVARVGLSTSTTLGTLSRYDGDGSMVAKEALFMDYPTHTAELKNANEIYLSQLKFQIRDSDGKIPTDLDTPLGIVFEIVEGA